MRKEKKNKKLILINLLSGFMIISTIFININNFKNGYFIGKIDSITKADDTNIVEVSPIKSTSSFARKIRANHKIEFEDSIRISGLTSRGKERIEFSPRAWAEMADNLIDDLEVGDSIIFKVNNYDKDNYKLDISELAMDLAVDD